MEYLFIGIILFLFFAANYYFEKLHIPPLLAYILLGLALSAVITDDLFSLVEHIGDVGIMLLFFLLGSGLAIQHYGLLNNN